MNREQRRRQARAGAAARPGAGALLDEAVRHHQAGRLDRAEALYREILAREPRQPDALHLLGTLALQSGQHATAVDLIRRAIAQRGDVADYHNNLGVALEKSGRPDEAIRAYERALVLHEAYAEARCNLANALSSSGRHADAVSHYRRVLALRPDLPSAASRLGESLLALGRAEEAVTCLERVVALRPSAAEGHHNLALALHGMKRHDDAARHARQAVALRPAYPEAYLVLGNALRAVGHSDAALTAYHEALRLRPDWPEACNEIGVLYQRRDTAEALRWLERALALRPDFAAAKVNQGIALRLQFREDEAAERFQEAVALDPALAEAHASLAASHAARSDPEGALEAYRRVWTLRDDPGTRVRAAMLLPPVARSREHMFFWRDRLEREVDALLADPPRLDVAPERVGQTAFYLAYHGLDDRPLQEKLARLYLRMAPSLAFASDFGARSDAAGRLRVGFASAYLAGHTIAKLTRGLMRHMDRERFEVVALPVGPRPTGDLAGDVDRVIHLEGEIPALREQIAAERLDVLIYPDIGMDAATYLLAFARLAPLQCVMWGHPVTTGIPTIDCFVSSEHVELPGAEAHYTERLVRLPHLPAFYQRPTHAPRGDARATLGFDAADRLYVCPQSLFKLHPDFDPVLGEILRRDPRGRLVLLEGWSARWGEILRERFAQAFPDVAERVTFLPRMSEDRFVDLLAAADALLDPAWFGGGNTSYEAFAVGAPIITWPGPYMRGRVTAGCYAQMGLSGCVVDSVEEYVEKALRLAGDANWRAHLREGILAAGSALYETHEAVRELEAFLMEAQAAASTTRIAPSRIHADLPGE